MRRLLKPPRQLVLTTPGKFFVGLTIAVGFGAINTGNNLLFLLMGMMLALMIVSGILSEAVIRNLKAARRAPERAFAGSEANGAYDVTNPGRFASLGIRIEDRRARRVRGPRSGETIGRKNHGWWKFWKKSPDSSDSVSSSFAIRVPAGESQRLNARYSFPSRGRYRLDAISIVTQFPFGFFDKSRELDDAADVVVYPEPADATTWLSDIRSRFGDQAASHVGPGEEFWALRDHREGEDHRSVHWKVSARRGTLIVRENEAQQQQSIVISLAHRQAEEPDRHTLEVFERGLEKTTGLLLELNERGYRIGLQTADTLIAPSDDVRDLDRMLAALATVELTRGAMPVLDSQFPTVSTGPRSALATASGAPALTLPFEEDTE